jgi:adenosine kinase
MKARRKAMRVVVTGSVAFDYLMSFPGRFREHILPDQIHQVSLSFLVDSMRKQRGGCAPNIAYNLALLGERPTVMATVGQDFAEYRAWLEAAGVDTSAILEIEDEFTSSFFVSTDQENNQIASFYIGAMAHADRLSFHHLDHAAIRVAIISPNAPAAMTKYARECQALGIPYIYDPSQQIVRLEGEELLQGIQGAQVLIGNAYEFGLIRSKTGLADAELRSLPEVTIVTQGEDGSIIYAGGDAIQVPAVAPRLLAEPTGVGDAYRAGLIKGLLAGLPWEVTGRLASVAASYVLEKHGTQEHAYSRQEFLARYDALFGPDARLQATLLGSGG